MKTNHLIGILVIVLAAVVSVMVYHPFGLRANESYATWNGKKGMIINAGDANASYSKAGTERFKNRINGKDLKSQRARAGASASAAKQGFQNPNVMKPPMPTPTAPKPTPTAPKPTPTVPRPTPTVPPAMPTPMTGMSNAAAPPPPPNAAMMPGASVPNQRMNTGSNAIQGFQNLNQNENQGMNYRRDMKEGFTSMNYGDVAGGAKDKYQPIGAFDGVVLPTGNNISSWRFTAPDEPLLGAEFTPGDDSLFIFKNNQCKPECAGASFSCSGGGVCTTPQQRSYINSRGGNRTAPSED